MWNGSVPRVPAETLIGCSIPISNSIVVCSTCPSILYTSIANTPVCFGVQACDIDLDVVEPCAKPRSDFVSIPFVLPTKDAVVPLKPLDGYHASLDDAHAILSKVSGRFLYKADVRLCNPRVLSYKGDNRMCSAYCVAPIKRSLIVSSFMTTTYSCRLFGIDPKPVVVEYIPHLTSELIYSYSHGSSMEAARASIRLKSRSLAALPIDDNECLNLVNGSERLALLKISQDFFGGGVVLLPPMKTPF
jgi:hypothetical protein